MAKTRKSTRPNKTAGKKCPEKGRRTVKTERAEALRKDNSFLVRHRSQCTICKHPQLKEITDAYLDGTSMVDIAEAYEIPDVQRLWRHVSALQLRTLREAEAAKSSAARCRHILSLCRFTADQPPSKEIALLAMRLEHDAHMATLPKKVQLSGSVEIKDRLVPLAEEMARNILLRVGVSKETVEKFLPLAGVEAITSQGLGKVIDSEGVDNG